MTSEDWRRMTPGLVEMYQSGEGTPPARRLTLTVRAPSQADATSLCADLAHRGYTDLRVSRHWWPFGRRWRVKGVSTPVHIQKQEVQAWVESAIQLADVRGAVFAGWKPNELSRRERLYDRGGLILFGIMVIAALGWVFFDVLIALNR